MLSSRDTRTTAVPQQKVPGTWYYSWYSSSGDCGRIDRYCCTILVGPICAPSFSVPVALIVGLMCKRKRAGFRHSMLKALPFSREAAVLTSHPLPSQPPPRVSKGLKANRSAAWEVLYHRRKTSPFVEITTDQPNSGLQPMSGRGQASHTQRRRPSVPTQLLGKVSSGCRRRYIGARSQSSPTPLLLLRPPCLMHGSTLCEVRSGLTGRGSIATKRAHL